jgi:DNA topoisomerase-3
MRVLFTAQDAQTIRDAFARAKPNAEYSSLYSAAVARRQADQIYNLSLTRTATVILGQGGRRVIGVGRVKTPTLAIVCKRELKIRNFVPLAYFEVVATAKVAGAQFQMRHAPQDRIVRREIAREVANAAEGFEGALTVRISGKGRPSCTICRHCRNYAARASAGQPARRLRWRRSSMTARARRSSPILAPRCATCRRA